MTIRFPTLPAFTLAAAEGRIPQLLINLGTAIHSSRLVQALCWSVVFLL